MTFTTAARVGFWVVWYFVALILFTIGIALHADGLDAGWWVKMSGVIMALLGLGKKWLPR